MLDFRLKTFLTLCEHKSYTKTANELHITQPAVTHHIQYLEQIYGGKLFIYEGHKLYLTPRGAQLYEFAAALNANSEKFQKQICTNSFQKHSLCFGATLTIGEYVMPPILEKILKEHPELLVTMVVENTHVLINKLMNGEIDFALLEGEFNKSKFESKVFSVERFMPICSPQSAMANHSSVISETALLQNRLITREPGSGTRKILEQILAEHNLTLSCFKEHLQIGNMGTIKTLVSDNVGISFVYESAVKKELKSGILKEISLPEFETKREFNFVYLKNSMYEQEYCRWYDFMQQNKQ